MRTHKSDFISIIPLLFEQMEDGKEYDIEIKVHREKRSLDANGYFWVLCGKLANKLGQDKTTVYRQLIKEIGDNFEIIPLRNDAVKRFIKRWGSEHMGQVCDILGESKIKGYTNVCAYYGSSTYDSKQMSRLIDCVVFECKEQGIETMTPTEIERLKNLWEQGEEKRKA